MDTHEQGEISRYTQTAETPMPRKKKKKPFRAVTAVKEMARERIGTPPPTRVVPDQKKQKKEKHKPTLGDLLQEG